jgi:hypothetical protein
MKLTVQLAKWGYARSAGIRASRILALTPAQRATPYKQDGQILDDEPELSGPPTRQAEEAPKSDPLPGAGRDLTTEGSVTGLGLSVGRFLKDVTLIDAQVAELIGVTALNVPVNDAAWAAGRKRIDLVPILQARTDRLRQRAAGLQEAVEVRYGERLGKPWRGVARALGLLKRSLSHLEEGSQASFVDGLDRYDQWHHAAMLKIERELTSKGVFLGDAGSGPAPSAGAQAPKPEGKKGKAASGAGARVKTVKGRRGR